MKKERFQQDAITQQLATTGESVALLVPHLSLWTRLEPSRMWKPGVLWSAGVWPGSPELLFPGHNGPRLLGGGGKLVPRQKTPWRDSQVATHLAPQERCEEWLGDSPRRAGGCFHASSRRAGCCLICENHWREHPPHCRLHASQRAAPGVTTGTLGATRASPRIGSTLHVRHNKVVCPGTPSAHTRGSVGFVGHLKTPVSAGTVGGHECSNLGSRW